MRNFTIVYIGFLICFSSAAIAEETNPLIGKWVEKFPNGKMLVTEFTATTVSVAPADSSGKLEKEPRVNSIDYKPSRHVALGEAYDVEFKEQKGDPGGILTYILIDPNIIVFNLPGVGAGLGDHKLTRLM